MKSPRLPRFTRAGAVSPIQLTERDRVVIRLVHRHRFLRSSQIVSLTAASPQQLLRRLQLLYHHGFLERPRAQLDYYHHPGSRHIVYGLGGKGAALLKQEGVSVQQHLRWGEKNRAVGRIYLEHALLVSEIMVALELACRQTGVRLLIADQLPMPDGTSQRFRWGVNVSGGVKLGVIPDRVFALQFQDENGEQTRAFFFLEADRGTMPVIRENLSQTSFYRKLLAYEATWAQGIHRTRFGFHRFRTLTVSQSVIRVKSLLDACSHLRSGHGLFLFADRSALNNPDILFSSIWRSGRGGEMTSIIGQSASFSRP
jgi:hypothetical protein